RDWCSVVVSSDLTECKKSVRSGPFQSGQPSNSLLLTIDDGQCRRHRHVQSNLQVPQQRHGARWRSGPCVRSLFRDHQDGRGHLAFLHVGCCEDQPVRPLGNQRSPGPGVLALLATWSLLSCLFGFLFFSSSFFRFRFIALWSNSLRNDNRALSRCYESFFLSSILHGRLVVLFALELLPVASQFQQGCDLL